MIITIGWNAGSGKSTTSKKLVSVLGYKFISIGDIRRAVAEKMGLGVYEFNILGSKPENELKFDKEFDIYQELDPNVILY